MAILTNKINPIKINKTSNVTLNSNILLSCYKDNQIHVRPINQVSANNVTFINIKKVSIIDKSYTYSVDQIEGYDLKKFKQSNLTSEQLKQLSQFIEKITDKYLYLLIESEEDVFLVDEDDILTYYGDTST